MNECQYSQYAVLSVSYTPSLFPVVLVPSLHVYATFANNLRVFVQNNASSFAIY